MNIKSVSSYYPRLCMQQKTHVSCNCEFMCTSYKDTGIKCCHYINILIYHTRISLNLKIALLKKKVCFTLHCNMNYTDSKIPFCVSQAILTRNHILMYDKVLKETYFNIQQNNKRAYTSVHKAARTIWLQAVQYLVFQLLYTAHLVDINAHIQNAIGNKTIITLNQLSNQKGQFK